MKEKIIIIGGGVGPMAGVALHKKIIANTLTNGTDQDHLRICHLSFSPDIIDRTKFVLGEVNENPAGNMAKLVLAQKALLDIGQTAGVAGVPCNTFHTPAIFSEFTRLLAEQAKQIKVLHMLEETAALISYLAPKAKVIGLMSTTGTRQAGVYRQILKPRGFTILEVPMDLQAELHDSIYNQEWGIKAINPITARARDNFLRYTRLLIGAGAQAIILGCTEIPLAMPENNLDGIPLIDPMLALARALIREANPTKLKPV